MQGAARIVLRTLGGFALERDGQRCELGYEKGRALLAYLAAESGRSHPRSWLATMFWPDHPRESALTNLRQVLLALRRALNPAGLDSGPLQVSRDAVCLDATAQIFIDLQAFTAPALQCADQPPPEHCGACLGQMESAAALYRGGFLAGLSLPDCPEFEDWLQIQREALHLHALSILARLAECLEHAGQVARALPVAARFLELEPWSEEGLRRVMRLYALSGQTGTALARFEASSQALRRELGVLPAEETRLLAGRIERGEFAPGAAAPMRPPLVAAPYAAAERRQLSVLYAELSPTAEDPDEAISALESMQLRCNAIVRGRGGFLVQAHGGGLLAYFGFPQASEHAAWQAVQSALDLVADCPPGFDLRVGVHTGIVITGGLDHPDAIGATSGLAIRLRQVVEPGEVAISGATHQLVAGYFECRPLGARSLRGIARPVEVHRVLCGTGARNRLEAESVLTPLVGRGRELGRLRSFWDDARQGRQRVVLITGEAGVGKSRLVHAFKDMLSGERFTLRELRCLPEHSQSPLHPLVDLLQRMLGFTADESAEERFARLVDYVESEYDDAAADTVPVLARALGLPVPAAYHRPLLAVAEQRDRLLSILLERRDELAARRPLLVVVEDLHWIDPSTLELLAPLLGGRRDRPILVLLTARSGFVWPAVSAPPVVELPVGALAPGETACLVEALAPDLPPATVGRIVERADGIPLFAEELTRDLAAGERQDIPPTLLDLLATRLDGMGPARAVAQAAATIGREFPVDLLARVVELDDAALEPLLGRLGERGLLAPAGVGRHQFRHALVRDAAYRSQTRSERIAVHRRIAAAIAEGAAEAAPGVLAQHWAAAGEAERAVAAWLLAGRQALGQSATQEALSHFRAGLSELEAMAASPERLRLELELQIGLGTALSSRHGYAAPEASAFYARAMMLFGRNDGDPAIFPALWRLWASASSRAGYPHALELARRLHRLALRDSNRIHLQQGLFALGNTEYWSGNFAAAAGYLERVLDSYRVEDHAAHVAAFGEDAGVTAAAYLSWTRWITGRPADAVQASERSLALARQLGHPFSLAYALNFAALLRCRLGQPDEALRLAGEALELAGAQGFLLWETGAALAGAWARALQGEREALATMAQCAELTRSAMAGVTLVALAPLAEACLVLGEAKQARRTCEQALAEGQALGDRHVEPELHRLRGEALLLAGRRTPRSTAAAEEAFRQALDGARRLGAKVFELRAAASLARLWQADGRNRQAAALLAEACAACEASGPTPDLEHARGLLDALRPEAAPASAEPAGNP